MHGKALPVSLGYFMAPIMLVLVGRVQFKERLSDPQKLAKMWSRPWRWARSCCASRPGARDLERMPRLSDLFLKRRMRTEGLGGHWLDMALPDPAGPLLCPERAIAPVT